MTHAQAQLYSLFWELNGMHFSNILPPIDLLFSLRLKTTGGQYFKKPKRLIQISARYFEAENAWQEIRSTLGHEMVHYWLDFLGKDCGHTPEFRRKMHECGFDRYSRLKPVGTKYVYQCPSCKIQYYRRKKGLWSCGPCSGPRFKIEFKLQLIQAL